MLGLFVLVLALGCAFAHSTALASLLASPCAFGFGALVARRGSDRPVDVVVEHRRHLGQST